MGLDELLDVNDGFNKFTKTVDYASTQKFISPEEASILINIVGNYVNSTVVMSNYEEMEARVILADVTSDLYQSIIVDPIHRGRMEEAMHTFTTRISLVRSAVDIIAAAIKRGLEGNESKKVYRSISANGTLGGQEMPNNSPFQNMERGDERK